MSGRKGVVAAALVVAACHGSEASSAPGLTRPASSAVSSGASVVEAGDRGVAPRRDGGSEGGEDPWPVLVREERWDAAWRALDAVSDDTKALPEVRYARARVALSRDDAAAAVPLLDGLESALPLLAEDIGRWRARAKLAVGPFEDAANWFAARGDPAAQLDAARAFEKANAPASARAAADRVVRSARRTRAQEAEARALRVRVTEPPGEGERDDARWLATAGVDVSPVDGLSLVARIDPSHPLSAAEMMTRAHVLSDAGRTDDALRAIDLGALAPGADKVTRLERARARGSALFRARGRGGEAAQVLADCAGAGGPHAAEDAFRAARALSRADRDEEAIHAYEAVGWRFPRSSWADDAAFYVPYLRMLHTEWTACAGGFDAYLHAHAKGGPGEHARDARRDGGLCKLLGGDPKGARVLFERLRDDVSADTIAGARMTNLAALAAMRDGDRDHAVALWTDVVHTRPLSWPALVARARLAEARATVPPPIDAGDAIDAGAPLRMPLPAPADLLQRIGLDADAEAALREREGAIASGAGGRVDEALCNLYGELGRARRRYQLGQALPSALFTTAPDERTRWAWSCAYPSPYATMVRATGEAEALPPGLLWAVMRQESGFDPDAVSPAHAVGLMQLLPETAQPVADELGIARDDARLTSPPFAIRIGARVLRKLLDRFHGDLPLAVAAYNCGAESVERWLSRAQGLELDTFGVRIPYDETRDYVARVMGNLARYGYLTAGAAGVPELDLSLGK